MTGTNIWDAVLARIETKVNRHSFYTWFKPTGFISDRPDGIQVRVPNSLFRDWLTKHYSGVLDEALREVDRSGASVRFVTDEGGPTPVELEMTIPAGPVPDDVEPRSEERRVRKEWRARRSRPPRHNRQKYG